MHGVNITTELFVSCTYKRSPESKRVTWKLNEISPLSNQGQGSLRAKFEATDCVPTTTGVQFMCEGTTMSGLEFELVGAGYRVSLTKKRLITGKGHETTPFNCRKMMQMFSPLKEGKNSRLLLNYLSLMSCYITIPLLINYI